MSKLSLLFGRIAGVPSSVLSQYSLWSGRPVTLGVAMVMLALLSGLGAASAFSQYKPNASVLAAATAGTLWAALFLTIESIVVRIPRGATWTARIGTLAFRLMLAGATAWCISTPFVLDISSPVLDAQLRKEARQQISADFDENARLARLDDHQQAAATAAQGLVRQDERLRHDPDTAEWRRAANQAQAAAQAEGVIRARLAPQIANALRRIESLRLSTMSPEFSIVEIQTLNRRVAGWRSEIGRATDAARRAIQAEDAIRRAWIASEREERDRLAALAANARTAMTAVEQKVADENAESTSEIERLAEANLVNRYSVFQRIVSDPEHPQRLALLTWAWMLHGIAFLFDVFVMMSKLAFPPDPIDGALKARAQAAEKETTLERKRSLRGLKAAARVATEHANLDATLAMRRYQLLINARLSALEAHFVWVGDQIAKTPQQAHQVVARVEDWLRRHFPAA